MQHTTCNTQQRMRDMQHTTRIAQRAAQNAQHATRDMRGLPSRRPHGAASCASRRCMGRARRCNVLMLCCALCTARQIDLARCAVHAFAAPHLKCVELQRRAIDVGPHGAHGLEPASAQHSMHRSAVRWPTERPATARKGPALADEKPGHSDPARDPQQGAHLLEASHVAAAARGAEPRRVAARA
jgi:hypothetical protein